MTNLQIQKFLNEILPIRPGYAISLTLFNTSSYYVFFDLFKDSSELKKLNKWRFIPINKAGEYYKELKKNKISDPIYSIIVDGESISKLELTKLQYSGIEY
jgi:hypothetical protein